MEERHILLGVGILLIIANKYLAKGFMWWEREVIRFKDSLNQWVYRILSIGIGLIFISIYILKD